MLRNSRLQRRTERYPAALTHLIPERLNNVTKDQTTAHKNKKHMLKFGIGLKQLEVVQLVYYKEEAAVSKRRYHQTTFQEKASVPPNALLSRTERD